MLLLQQLSGEKLFALDYSWKREIALSGQPITLHGVSPSIVFLFLLMTVMFNLQSQSRVKVKVKVKVRVRVRVSTAFLLNKIKTSSSR